MKKEHWWIFLELCGVLLLIGFGIRLWADYVNTYPWGSAPFYVYIMERAVEFVIPAVLCIVGGIVLKKRGIEQ